jgi:hypothetical protein
MTTSAERIADEASQLVHCCAEALAAGREPAGMASVLTDEKWQLITLIRFVGTNEDDITEHKLATFSVLGGALRGADAVVTVLPAHLKVVPHGEPVGERPSQDPASGSVLVAITLAFVDINDEAGAVKLAAVGYPYGLRDDGTYWLGDPEPLPLEAGGMLGAIAEGVARGPLTAEVAAAMLAKLEHDVVLPADGNPRFN